MIETPKSPRGMCHCLPEEQHGETSIMCCNRCGMPTEDFWNVPEEVQADLWREMLIIYNLEGAEGVESKFHITRK